MRPLLLIALLVVSRWARLRANESGRASRPDSPDGPPPAS